MTEPHDGPPAPSRGSFRQPAQSAMPDDSAQTLPAEDSRPVSGSAEVRGGSPLPWGAQPHAEGVNFSLFSRHATGVRLELYDHPEDPAPARVIDLDPLRHRTGDVWHVWVKGLAPGQLYAFRVEGPYEPASGHRFNPCKLLLDPFATAITGANQWDFRPARGFDPAAPYPDATPSAKDDAAAMPRCVFTHDHYDWEGVRPPGHPSSDMVIYETHVRGLTIHPSSGAQHPGTYRGLVERIPYFRDLGVTTLELMPIQEFNENELIRVNPQTGERLRNYWGYNPVAFFAPKGSYASRGNLGQQTLEFKEMVKAFHRAGIEIIIDVVLNHTAEGNQLGPTLCLRGIDNSIYYMTEETDPGRYKDFTGTGNTINANHPVVREFIKNALRYWVTEMRVDGFRFDLASVLGRGEDGRLLPNPPLLESIAEDPILREVKLIAEAWDEGGAYQVGNFSERRWAEWNGRFRDDVRRFWARAPGAAGAFASRLSGSSDLYQSSGKTPGCSVNFITCHDGFTLNDLVSYSAKHNEANGEGNRDGNDVNFSDNCGVEGPSDDPGVGSLRRRQIKNFLLTLFVSRGIPMLLGGDEFRRTQRGNNNAYCQDNQISWYDWGLAEKNREIHRFCRGMIAFRRAHPVLRQETFYTVDDLRWFNPEGAVPDWFDPETRSLACLIFGRGEPDLCLIFNAGVEPAAFVLPKPFAGGSWRLAADTFRDPPQDFLEDGRELTFENQGLYRVGPRSSVILLARS
ncbi:MAG TPA: glycogen debranching protein GlgX [Patescibacteria group bacterium]|nr:glycogen debranching protein GlgX [Patescibacteria group bacterium]